MIKHVGSIFVDGHEVAETMQCCHCGGHFVYRKGSGTDRGFCTLCNQMTCGKKACDPHVPFEKKLDLLEQNYGKTLEFGL